jgi:hypothetical protein
VAGAADSLTASLRLHQLGESAVEGRAIWVRPSLCVLFLLGLVGFGSLHAPAAQAAPFKPVLTGTDPASPNISLTPRIQGREGGIVISVVHSISAMSGAVRSALDPDATITIYNEDPTCSSPGAVVEEGTAGELDGPGIPIPEGIIAANSVTTFYATQADGSGTSPCSEGLKYRQVTTAPEPPVPSSVSPASPADNNSPRVFGSADPEAIVSIFSGSTCSGAALGAGPGAEFAGSGIEVSVPDNSTTIFSARAELAGIPSACASSSISYQELTPKRESPPTGGTGAKDPGGKGPADIPGKPPAPKLRTLPANAANNNTPLVTGSAPGTGRVEIFVGSGCKGEPLANGSATEFAAGLPVHVLDNTTTAFYGVSIDGGDDRSPCSPTPAVYVEDSTKPLTRITMGPGVKTRKRTAVFRFLDSAGETPGTTFFCKLDRRRWQSCAPPFRAKRLTRSAHLFQVKAVDAAGNREKKPAKRRFKVVR